MGDVRAVLRELGPDLHPEEWAERLGISRVVVLEHLRALRQEPVQDENRRLRAAVSAARQALAFGKAAEAQKLLREVA